ncbi:hypothetical protein BKA64DRAFT_69619 [Cadophora sp. MPI-SDFR-AT-0126]|nr:hypothetical protein BKA64DRAFT_69619 [Leotiomycetes sp. MPI-SDFR-AT-0126]
MSDFWVRLWFRCGKGIHFCFFGYSGRSTYPWEMDLACSLHDTLLSWTTTAFGISLYTYIFFALNTKGAGIDWFGLEWTGMEPGHRKPFLYLYFLFILFTFYYLFCWKARGNVRFWCMMIGEARVKGDGLNKDGGRKDGMKSDGSRRMGGLVDECEWASRSIDRCYPNRSAICVFNFLYILHDRHTVSESGLVWS